MENSGKDLFNISKDKDFSNWYLELVRKSKLMDQRSPVKGFDVVMPNAYAIWEGIRAYLDPRLKALGVRNAYFPLAIPESLLQKEAEHFEGFVPEVAWVTHGGKERLGDRLALRPTSEAIINYMFALWIRSYQDLPLMVNQWCNIVRWETKMTKPFLRGREFLWQEGHTAFADAEGAQKNVMDVLCVYKELVENLLKIATFFVKRPEWDKFAGAEETISLETLMPDGKVLQAGTVHNLGQNFSNPLGISFLDEGNDEKNVYQTSWGVSTRLIGAVVMSHGDDKGLVLPFELAPTQVAIIPIIFKGKEKAVLGKCEKVRLKLENAGFSAEVDLSDKRPGEKHYYWELMGAPIRLEIGPRDIKGKKVVIAPRIGGKKQAVPEKELLKAVEKTAESMDDDILCASAKRLKDKVREAKSLKDVKRIIKSGGIAKAPFVSVGPEGKKWDDELKEKTGAEVRGTLYPKPEVPKEGAKCVVSGEEAGAVVYIAKAY